MWIGDVERCRSLDARAAEEFGVPSRVLMERAGMCVYEAWRALLPKGGSVAVLCGRGNNGGDGFVAARVGHESGYRVQCLAACSECDLVSGAAEQLAMLRQSGVEPIFATAELWPRAIECLRKKDLIVDGLLGTGAKCEVRGHVRQAIQAINRSGVPVVSIDVPSGIDGDTGDELGESVWALRTVTFGLPKPFLFQGIGVEHSGYWTVEEIGIPHALLNEPTGARLIENDWVANLLPERMRCSHKGENGSLLIVAGSERMPGAATMAAQAAIRSGVGLVTVAAVHSVCERVANHVPEALLLPLPSSEGAISMKAAPLLLEAQERCHGAVFGPGLSQGGQVREVLERVWSEWRLPSVIDADALNAVSAGAELPACECVLTPHPGEMSRLLHSSVAEIQADRFAAATHAAQTYRQAVLLKGPYTIVAELDQPMIVNQTGNPGMASGGMGDVLSGIVGALLAEDLPGYYAAACGMYWHGFAGDLAAEEIGPIGYTAMELADRLPRARAKITSICDAC